LSEQNEHHHVHDSLQCCVKLFGKQFVSLDSLYLYQVFGVGQNTFDIRVLKLEYWSTSIGGLVDWRIGGLMDWWIGGLVDWWIGG
jgi:hypothetical protein